MEGVIGLFQATRLSERTPYFSEWAGVDGCTYIRWLITCRAAVVLAMLQRHLITCTDIHHMDPVHHMHHSGTSLGSEGAHACMAPSPYSGALG